MHYAHVNISTDPFLILSHVSEEGIMLVLLYMEFHDILKHSQAAKLSFVSAATGLDKQHRIPIRLLHKDLFQHYMVHVAHLASLL
jgi:hypothetical protein